MSKSLDLTGQRFGELLVIGRSDITQQGKRTWLCRCSCGGIKNALTNNLKRGDVTKCGNCLVGKRFGCLVVKKDSGERSSNGGKRYGCVCDCGKWTVVNSKDLKSGDSKSCGCLAATIYTPILEKGSNADVVEQTRLSLISPDKKMSSQNTSGVTGVSFYKKTNKYEAYISVKKKRIRLGYFETVEEAAKARKAAEEKYFQPILEKYGKETEAEH